MQLTVDQVETLDVTLSPRSIVEKVTVNGDTVPPLDLSDAQIGSVVTSEQINSLPLILRLCGTASEDASTAESGLEKTNPFSLTTLPSASVAAVDVNVNGGAEPVALHSEQRA